MRRGDNSGIAEWHQTVCPQNVRHHTVWCQTTNGVPCRRSFPVTALVREDVAVDDLHTDRPTAVELLEIVAATLSETVVPATAPHAQHQARVAANLCRILGRELAADARPAADLPASLFDTDDATADAVFDDVVELVRAKLEINKPGYDTHGAQSEREIIA